MKHYVVTNVSEAGTITAKPIDDTPLFQTPRPVELVFDEKGMRTQWGEATIINAEPDQVIAVSLAGVSASA